MCTVSMIGDHYRDYFPQKHPWTNPYMTPNTSPVFPDIALWPAVLPQVSRAEFDALRAEVENMKELLRCAKIYDEVNGEPECEIDEKMDILRKVAKLVGVDLDDVIGKK